MTFAMDMISSQFFKGRTIASGWSLRANEKVNSKRNKYKKPLPPPPNLCPGTKKRESEAKGHLVVPAPE
ncbi:hypothetical protein CHS0354_028178 [Potamilus streckersoni]|uniref:Uncharacterized protein n=1 Tax=Potamilus streckersoni TaxID=2493646 RepID=A0AAE0TIV2_9BIVA|nr:hypothetical protein CHS0354_028178 [Potamilus streckersoni]